jgi:hypothetical protein
MIRCEAGSSSAVTSSKLSATAVPHALEPSIAEKNAITRLARTTE